jgi:hypothetical protein
MVVDVDRLLLDWQEAKQILDAAKEKEMILRKMIVEESDLFDENKTDGTETRELGNGWKLKAVKKTNYTVDNTDGVAFEILRDIAAMDPVSAHIAKDVLKFTPELRLTKYRELNPQARRLLDSIITTKPGAPTLELLPPKGDE